MLQIPQIFFFFVGTEFFHLRFACAFGFNVSIINKFACFFFGFALMLNSYRVRAKWGWWGHGVLVNV